MLEIPLVTKGQWVHRGDQIGKCGSTGNSTGAHCHHDCPLIDMSKSLWREYVYGLTLAQVKARYADPRPFSKNGVPMNANAPLAGYHYLQGVRDTSRGLYFHSGEDWNGVNDLGVPIYSPVEGRVVHVGVDNVGATKFAKGGFMRKSLERILNGGWGYFVVIEEKPGYILP